MRRPVTPAITTVRGFAPRTPVTSGDEDSDSCTKPFGKNSGQRDRRAHATGDVSPAVSGIAQLRLKVEHLGLNMETNGSNPTTATSSSSRASSMTRSDSRPWHPSPLTSITSASGRTLSRDVPHVRSRKHSSDDDAASEATTSYEIDLEHEFASETTGGSTEHRKVTADDFEPLRCLGKGTYGTVLLVKERRTGRLFAQKQFKKASLVVHKKLIEQTKTEREILESLNHHDQLSNFIVKLFFAFQDHQKLYLILEYGQGGELFTHLSTERMFPEPTAAFYMAEMVLALSHLHQTLGVVYRDLKPENCLLDAEGHLLLTDFGLSKVACDADACNSMLGTVEYMAPEVIQGKRYGWAVDWWSFGALGYDLMTGNPPFRGPNNAKIQENIVKQKLVLPYFLSTEAKDLLTRLLRKDPAKRLGSNMPKDLATIKGHRFFRKIDWKLLAGRLVEPPIQPMITDPELAENFAPEFTELSLSPVVSRLEDNPWNASLDSHSVHDENLFGGFSFVAPSSLLESHGLGLGCAVGVDGLSDGSAKLFGE